MLGYVYHALECFQSAFSRQRRWLLFGAVVLSFLAAEEPAAADSRPNLAKRVVQMALSFGLSHDGPVLLVLDAYFASAGGLRLAHSVYSIVLKQPYVAVLTRAKKNYATCASSFPPEARDKVGAESRKRHSKIGKWG
jgi:hypothetical protein